MSGGWGCGGGGVGSEGDSEGLRVFCNLPPATQQALLAYPDLVNRCLNRYAETGAASDCLLELLDSCPEMLTAVDNRVYRESALGCALLRKHVSACWRIIEIAKRYGLLQRVLRHRNSSGHTLLMLAVDLDTESEGGPIIRELLNEWPEQVHTCYDTEGRNVLHHCAADGRAVSLGVILRHLLDSAPAPALVPVASALNVPDSAERLTPIHYMARACRPDMLQTVADFAVKAGLAVNFDQPWPTGQTPLLLAAVADFAARPAKEATCRWLTLTGGANPRTALADLGNKSNLAAEAKALLNSLLAELPDDRKDEAEEDDDYDDVDEAEAEAEDGDKEAAEAMDAAIDQVQRLRVVEKPPTSFSLSDSARRRLADGLRQSATGVNDSERFLTALAARSPALANAKEFLALSPQPVLLGLSLAMAADADDASGSVRSAIEAALKDVGRRDLVPVLAAQSDAS